MKPGILVWDDNVQLHKKNFFLGGGDRPKGFHQIAPKRILFFSVTNTTDFDHV